MRLQIQDNDMPSLRREAFKFELEFESIRAGIFC